MGQMSREMGSDESMKALHFILEAWEEGAVAGVSTDHLAYAALFAALTDLVGSYGEENVSTLIDGLRRRIMGGEFTIAGRPQ